MNLHETPQVAPQTIISAPPVSKIPEALLLRTRIAAALTRKGLSIEDFEPCASTEMPHTEQSKALIACTTRGTAYLLLEPDEKGRREAYRDGEHPIIVLGDGQIQWHGGESMQVSVVNQGGVLRDGEPIQFQLLEHNGVIIETFGKLAAADCLRQKS